MGDLIDPFGTKGNLIGAIDTEFVAFFHCVDGPVLSCPLKGHVSN
jgi:hypothetical protein